MSNAQTDSWTHDTIDYQTAGERWEVWADQTQSLNTVGELSDWLVCTQVLVLGLYASARLHWIRHYFCDLWHSVSYTRIKKSIVSTIHRKQSICSQWSVYLTSQETYSQITSKTQRSRQHRTINYAFSTRCVLLVKRLVDGLLTHYSSLSGLGWVPKYGLGVPANETSCIHWQVNQMKNAKKSCSESKVTYLG